MLLHLYLFYGEIGFIKQKSTSNSDLLTTIGGFIFSIIFKKLPIIFYELTIYFGWVGTIFRFLPNQ